MTVVTVILMAAEIGLLSALVYFAYHGHKLTKNLYRVEQSRAVNSKGPKR